MKKKKSSEYQSVNLLLRSFLFLIVLGSVLLKLPICHPGFELSYLDSLFTATSAVCVTGLIVIDTSLFSIWGKAVILILIQLGGVGIMLFATFFLYILFEKISLSGRLLFKNILPEISAKNLFTLLKRIFLFIIIFESLGALFLYLFVFNKFEFNEAVLHSVFHSVSAFCNAGFSTFSNSLEGFKSNTVLNIVVMCLIVLGGLGFVVYEDIYHKIRVYLKFKKRQKLKVHTKLVLIFSGLLILSGAILFYVLEYKNILAELGFKTKILVSFFQSVTARTAGFNTVNIYNLSNPTLLILIFLMFIGGAPASCAGGLKITTFAVICLMVYSVFKKRTSIHVFNRKLPLNVIVKVLTLFLISISIIFLAVILISVFEYAGLEHFGAKGSLMRVLFESVSAFATVGLSMGLTAGLSSGSKIMLIFLMYVGRLGPLTFGILFVERMKKESYEYPEEDVLIG